MSNHIIFNTESKEFSWSDEHTNERACKGCGNPTTGRADYASKHFSYVNRPCCILCAVKAAFED